MKLLIAIPALNEEESIDSIIRRSIEAREFICANSPATEVAITVVSDGSTDRTVERASRYKDSINLIVFPQNKGYGAAIKEAKSLLDAAGQNNMRSLDFMVRDLNHHKLFGQAIEAMLREVGIQSNLRTVVESVWFGDATAGNYDLAVGAIVSTLLDPSDYFNAWYRTDGPQNYSFWHNAEFDKLVDQIDVEVDAEKRLALIRQAEDVMEHDPPLVPVAWENILDVWYNYVRGHNPKDYFGIYDVVRFDTFWLDKA